MSCLPQWIWTSLEAGQRHDTRTRSSLHMDHAWTGRPGAHLLLRWLLQREGGAWGHQDCECLRFVNESRVLSAGAAAAAGGAAAGAAADERGAAGGCGARVQPLPGHPAQLPAGGRRLRARRRAGHPHRADGARDRGRPPACGRPQVRSCRTDAVSCGECQLIGMQAKLSLCHACTSALR